MAFVKFFQHSWKNAGQLSIYPTATLTFVILFLGVKIRKTWENDVWNL
jgi:hypothetical protein